MIYLVILLTTANLLEDCLSRLDISFVVHKLSQLVAKSRVPHLQVVHVLLRDLKGSSGQGVLLPTALSFQIKAFSNAYWASCLDYRKSTVGFCIF